jgi:Mrp family chromosome partitioning ATPase
VSGWAARPGRLEAELLGTRGTPGGGASGPLPRPQGWAPDSVLEQCAHARVKLTGRAVPSIGVTSCARREGRTSIAAALAVVERCDHHHRTILAELDLEQPSLAKRLGVPGRPGVAEVLRGEASLDDAIRWVGEDLGVLVAGEVGDRATDLQARLVGGRFLPDLEELCDTVIVDLPPLEPTGTGAPVANLCSLVVLVVRAGATPVDQIRRAVSGLDTPPPVILNAVQRRGPRWLNGMLGGGR